MGGKYASETMVPLNLNEIWLPYWGISKFDTIALGAGNILEYHKSWDWLMPVVEKIENLDIVALGCCRAYGDKFIYNNEGFSVKIEGNSCEIWIHFTFDPESSVTIVQGNSKLEAVYEACLDFVDWFQINFANVIP